MSKENENEGAEIKVQIVNKKETFWQRNRQKIVKALEITGASVVSFVAGMITSDLLFNKQMKDLPNVAEPEVPDVLPFDDADISE